MYGKAYIKFDLKKRKEYIYVKYIINEDKKHEDDIGRTFIDFLANSDKIIDTIKSDAYSYYKNDKLKDTSNLHTLVQDKMKEINPLFKIFDYDKYISDYIKDLRNKNSIKINTFLAKIKNTEKVLKYYNSRKFYDEMIEEGIAMYHDYDSKEFNKYFNYIDNANKETIELMKKYEEKYGHSISEDTRKKIQSKNKSEIKGDFIINEIEKKIYNENEIEIKKYACNEIKSAIKQEKANMKFYKQIVKHTIKENEKTLEQILDEDIDVLKFWIDFSKHILVNFYKLTSNKEDNKLSSNQRLLSYLLEIKRNFYSDNIFELPKSEITLELKENENTMYIDEFITRNIDAFINSKEEIFSRINAYNVNLIQEYSINSIVDFISVSLIQILQNNIKLCCCENCGKLFISTNKSNEKYCTYEFKGEKTCRDLSYSIHLKKDELSNILRKKYRTENAKKNRNQHIPEIEEKFQRWYSKAKQQKELCEKGKISLNDFNKWLKDNSKWF